MPELRTEDDYTIGDFIDEYGLSMIVKRTGRNPHTDYWPPDARHWMCRIAKIRVADQAWLNWDTSHLEHNFMDVPFSQGSAHTEPPELAEVLDCLASDASCVEQHTSAYEFGEEMGYEKFTDYPKAENIWRAINDQYDAMRDLFGKDGLDRLIYHTERL